VWGTLALWCVRSSGERTTNEVGIICDLCRRKCSTQDGSLKERSGEYGSLSKLHCDGNHG
jgi:hypothetical protein